MSDDVGKLSDFFSLTLLQDSFFIFQQVWGLSGYTSPGGECKLRTAHSTGIKRDARTHRAIRPSSEPFESSYTSITLPKSPTSIMRATSPRLLTPTTCHVVMMIAAKNGAITIATATMMIGQKARGLGNFVDADQMMSYVADQTL